MKISRDIDTLTQLLRNKNLTLSVHNSRCHISNCRNDLIFIGTFEECFEWVEKIIHKDYCSLFVEPILLGFYPPVELPDYQTRVYILGFLACLLFAIGIFFQPLIGLAGIPAILTALYYFHLFHKTK